MNGIDFIKALDDGMRLTNGNIIAEKVDDKYRVYSEDFSIFASGYKLDYCEISKSIYLCDSIIEGSTLYICLTILPTYFRVME